MKLFNLLLFLQVMILKRNTPNGKRETPIRGEKEAEVNFGWNLGLNGQTWLFRILVYIGLIWVGTEENTCDSYENSFPILCRRCSTCIEVPIVDLLLKIGLKSRERLVMGSKVQKEDRDIKGRDLRNYQNLLEQYHIYLWDLSVGTRFHLTQRCRAHRRNPLG